MANTYIFNTNFFSDRFNKKLTSKYYTVSRPFAIVTSVKTRFVTDTIDNNLITPFKYFSI